VDAKPRDRLRLYLTTFDDWEDVSFHFWSLFSKGIILRLQLQLVFHQVDSTINTNSMCDDPAEKLLYLSKTVTSILGSTIEPPDHGNQRTILEGCIAGAHTLTVAVRVHMSEAYLACRFRCNYNTQKYIQKA